MKQHSPIHFASVCEVFTSESLLRRVGNLLDLEKWSLSDWWLEGRAMGWCCIATQISLVANANHD